MTLGEYEVIGPREYRGHKTGEIFEMRDMHAGRRAQARGDIRLIRWIEPELQPGSWELPDGWVSKATKNREE